jgi:hypothetical protein
MAGFASIFFLATFIEGLVEYMFAKEGESQKWMKYVALAFGVVLAVAYRVDIPSLLGLAANYGVVNYIVSGLIIGRGSNYVNDVLTTITGK